MKENNKKMCVECRRFPCDYRCPNYSGESYERCGGCSQEIYTEDEVFRVGGKALCCECFYNYCKRIDVIDRCSHSYIRKNELDFLTGWWECDEYLNQDERLGILHDGFLRQQKENPRRALEAQREYIESGDFSLWQNHVIEEEA